MNNEQMREALLDCDGENKAVRCFLLHYQNPGVTIGALRNALRRSGFNGCWPDWVNGKETSESITKAGAQLWIRYLFNLEQALADVKETPKNEHDSVDVLKRAPLVRLTEDEISKIENRVWANTINKGGLMALFISRFAKAIQDAMVKKNGG